MYVRQIKQHQLVSGQSSQYGRMYEEAIDSARNSELMRPVGVIPGRPELVVLGTIVRSELISLRCIAVILTISTRRITGDGHRRCSISRASREVCSV